MLYLSEEIEDGESNRMAGLLLEGQKRKQANSQLCARPSGERLDPGEEGELSWAKSFTIVRCRSPGRCAVCHPAGEARFPMADGIQTKSAGQLLSYSQCIISRLSSPLPSLPGPAVTHYGINELSGCDLLRS